MIIELEKGRAAPMAGLFAHLTDSLFQSFLQGHFGRGWVDALPNPACGQVMVADFSYYAGDAACAAARELAANVTEFTIAVPEDRAWADLLEEVHGERCAKRTRYAIHNDGDCFDRAHLRELAAALPEGYRVVRMDEALCRQALASELMQSLCCNFASIEDFLHRGVGFCAVRDGAIASGASSYTIYDQGLEVEVDTEAAHRRKGLAAACAATLILHCLERGWYPCWDAANTGSVALAEKLGYRFDREYDVYYIQPK